MSGASAAGGGRLVVGDLTRELFAAFRGEVEAWRRKDALAPGVVLVGSNLLKLHLARRLALEGTPHAGLRFVTFVDLANALAAPRLATLAPIPPGGRALLARHLATSDENGAVYFASVAACPGFRHRLAKTFGDLDDAGFAEDAAALAKKWGGRDEKLADVLRLYSGYREKLAGRFATTSDTIRLAALEAGQFASVFGCDRLALFGFYDFTEVQRRLLSALASSKITMTAFAPDPDVRWQGFARGAVEFLERIGLAITRETAAGAPASASTGAATGATVAPPLLPPALEIISAPGEVEESREIARMVLRIARVDGVPFRKIAVLLRSASTYAAPLREAFDEAGIPFYLREGLTLADTPTGKAFDLLLGLGGSRFERSEVIEFLTAAPLAHEVLRGEAAAISPSSWDRATRLAGIVEGRDEWRSRLARLEKAPGSRRVGISDADRSAARSLRRFIEPLFDDLERIPTRDSWAGFAEHWQRILTRWLAPLDDRSRIEDTIAGLAANDGLVRETTLDEFREAVREALDDAAGKSGRFGIECVTITELHKARGVPFRVVFIPGVVERAFPAPVLQDPILLDSDRDELNRTRAGALELGRDRAREDEMLFALALASARDRVVLTCPRFESGTTRVRTPSALVFRAAEAKYGPRYDSDTLSSAPDYRYIPLSAARIEEPDRALTEHERRVALALTVAPRERAAFAAALASESAPFARRAALLAARASGLVNAHTGALSRSTMTLVRDARPLLSGFLSPSAMETYAKCPYQYFLQQVLKIEHTPEPERIDEIDFGDCGRLVHAILHDLYGELATRGLWPLDAERIDAAHDLLAETTERHFRAAADAGITGYAVLWRLKRSKILAALRALIVWEAGEASSASHGDVCNSMMVEKAFGDDGLAQVSWEIGTAQPIRFRGQIDRVDSSPGGRHFVVTDYKLKFTKKPGKAGVVEPIDPTFEGGEALQLPVYLLAARAILEESGAKNPTGSARYLKILLESAGVRPAVLSSEEFAEMRERFTATLRTIAGGIRTGFFPQFPNDEAKNCRWCDFKQVCGPKSSIIRLCTTKMEDPRFAPFLAMKEGMTLDEEDAE